MYFNFYDASQPYFFVNQPYFNPYTPQIQCHQYFTPPQTFPQNTILCSQNALLMTSYRTTDPQLLQPEVNTQGVADFSVKKPSCLQRNSGKTKEIKKPTNRPATYLTERKYYLSQVIQEADNEGRVLRNRNLKKKKTRRFQSQKVKNINEKVSQSVLRLSASIKKEISQISHEQQTPSCRKDQMLKQSHELLVQKKEQKNVNIEQ